MTVRSKHPIHGSLVMPSRPQILKSILRDTIWGGHGMGTREPARPAGPPRGAAGGSGLDAPAPWGAFNEPGPAPGPPGGLNGGFGPEPGGPAPIPGGRPGRALPFIQPAPTVPASTLTDPTSKNACRDTQWIPESSKESAVAPGKRNGRIDSGVGILLGSITSFNCPGTFG